MLELRDLCRHKSTITRMRVKIQNKIKCRLMVKRVEYPKYLWTEKNLALLREWNDPILSNLLVLRESVLYEEKEVLSRIQARAQSSRLANLLKTIPGIAHFGALMILGEIADITHFKTAKKLVMYAGLCPGVYQTGNTERNVKNYAVNKNLKWILTECSGRATILPGTKFQEMYAKMKQKKNAKVARRAVARHMLIVIWHMLQNEEPYHTS
jgi:transposase